MNKAKLFAVVWLSVLTCSLVWGQEQKAQPGDMSSMDPAMADMPASGPSADIGAEHAMQSMEGRHMDMGSHMKMTNLRNLVPGDQERADKVVAGAKAAAERYQDYHAALNDGFKIFLPKVPQKQYHFISRRNAIEAQFRFNPEHPTSLLYEKQGDDYKLVGVMYTAPKRMTENDLNQRIPLSIAQWHEHVNLCFPPKDKRQELWSAHPQFGLAGSITTREACDEAGGKFFPVVFNWMVHVYPFESNAAGIWAVDRGHDHHDGD